MEEKTIKVLPIYLEKMQDAIKQLGNTRETLKALIIGYAKHYNQKYTNWDMDFCIEEATNFILKCYEQLEIEIPQ